MASFFDLFRRNKKHDEITVGLDYKNDLTDGNIFKNHRIFTIVPFQGQTYDNPIVRSCVDTNAKYRAKARPLHKRNGKDVEDKNIVKLFRRPNIYMNYYDMVQKASCNYDLMGECFIWIDFDKTNGKPIGMYPLSPVEVEAIKFDDDDELYLKFKFSNGKVLIALYRDVIHLRKSFFDKDNTYLFGDNAKTPLRKILEWDHNLNEATSKYLTSIGITTGAIEVSQVINPEDLNKLQENFKKSLTESDTDYRLVVLRPGMKYNPIQTKDITYPKDFDESNKNKIYELFNCNEHIVKGDFDGRELNSYAETAVKPFTEALEYELTEKLFQKKDRDRGDEIRLVFDEVQMLDPSARMTVLKQMFDTGSITPNEIRNKMGYKDLEVESDNAADQTFTSLNYTTTENLENYQNSPEE